MAILLGLLLMAASPASGASTQSATLVQSAGDPVFGRRPDRPSKPVRVKSAATLRSGGVSNADYPAAALRAAQKGISDVAFTVGVDGRLRACSAKGAGEMLDTEACKLLLRRLRFVPATDRRGRAIEVDLAWQVAWDLGNYVEWWKNEEEWRFEEGRRPVTKQQILLGSSRDRPLCWIEKVVPRGRQRLDIYFAGDRDWLLVRDKRTRQLEAPLARTAPGPESGKPPASRRFTARLGDALHSNNSPHDSCSMNVLLHNGKIALYQHANFSWH